MEINPQKNWKNRPRILGNYWCQLRPAPSRHHLNSLHIRAIASVSLALVGLIGLNQQKFGLISVDAIDLYLKDIAVEGSLSLTKIS
jgi:hypothetical protein